MKRSFYILIALIITVLGILLLSRGCNTESDKTPGAPTVSDRAAERQPVPEQPETAIVTVYYLTSNGQYLLPLTQTVATTTEPARCALELVLADAPSNLLPSVPPDVKLLDFYAIYKILYVDLSAEFLSIAPEKSQLAVDAILATVLQLLPGYQLQILVNGEGREYINDVYIGEPLGMPVINPCYDLIENGNAAEAASFVCYSPVYDYHYLLPQTIYYRPQTDDALTEQLMLIASRTLPVGVNVSQLTKTNDYSICLWLSSEQPLSSYGGEAYQKAWRSALAESCGLLGITNIELQLPNNETEILNATGEVNHYD